MVRRWGMSRFLVAILLGLLLWPGIAATAEQPAVQTPPKPLPSLREQAAIRQEWLKLRLERVLPPLMRKHGVQMWLVICREYDEDPVFYSLVSPTVFAARRRTIYVFFDRGEEKGIERVALGGGSNGGLYTVYRDPEVENRELWGQGQWALLRKLIEERNPATIAIDISRTHAFSDGLSAGEREALEDALGPKWISRCVRAENLALEYVSIRPPEMLPTYRQLMETAHYLIERAFSSEVIHPGVTTNTDVVWWLRQQLNDHGLGTWFHPTVDVQRPGLKQRSTWATRVARGRARTPRRDPKGAGNQQPAAGPVDGTYAARPLGQRNPGRNTGRDEGRGHQRLDLFPSDWRPRARRRAADRALGPPARRTGTRRCAGAAEHVVFHRARCEHTCVRVERPGTLGRPGRGCRARRRQDWLGASTPDEISPDPLAASLLGRIAQIARAPPRLPGLRWAIRPGGW